MLVWIEKEKNTRKAKFEGVTSILNSEISTSKYGRLTSNLGLNDPSMCSLSLSETTDRPRKGDMETSPAGFLHTIDKIYIDVNPDLDPKLCFTI